MHRSNTPLTMLSAGLATVPAGETLQDWRDQDHQIEQQAQCLDRIRSVLDQVSDHNSWKYQFWRSAETRVLNRWRQMDQIRIAGLRTNYQLQIERDYQWWEPHDPGSGGGDKPMNWRLEEQLEHSWDQAQEHRLQQARLGLA